MNKAYAKLYECPSCHEGVVIETLSASNKQNFCNCLDYNTAYPMGLRVLAPASCLLCWDEELNGL